MLRRPPEQREIELIEHLLDHPLPGIGELKAQLLEVLVSGSCPILDIHVAPGAPLARDVPLNPIRGVNADETVDAVWAEVTLSSVNGRLSSLELTSSGPDYPVAFPNPEEVRLVRPFQLSGTEEERGRLVISWPMLILGTLGLLFGFALFMPADCFDGRCSSALFDAIGLGVTVPDSSRLPAGIGMLGGVLGVWLFTLPVKWWRRRQKRM